jgi:hypothetical protein
VYACALRLRHAVKVHLLLLLLLRLARAAAW